MYYGIIVLFMYKVFLYVVFGGFHGRWCGVGVVCKDDKKVVIVWCGVSGCYDDVDNLGCGCGVDKIKGS